jgi:predicted O-linked N-acetylglucosamine transferase (SPINDLY family)
VTPSSVSDLSPDARFYSALTSITSGAIDLGALINACHGLTQVGRPDLALQLYKVWCGFNATHPQLFAVEFNRAVLLSGTGDAAEAEVAFRAAIENKPDFMPAYINLGGVLERKGEVGEAVTLWMSAVERLKDVSSEALNYKTVILKQISRVLMDNQNPAAEAMLLSCLENDSTQRDAVGQYVPLRISQCKWPVVVPTAKIDHATLMRGIQPLSLAAYSDDPLMLLAAAWFYVKEDVDTKVAPPPVDRRDARIDLTDRRMRIGYVSSDLRDHAIGYLMAELFELHDRSKVEVFAYYCGPPSDSAHAQRNKAALEHWVDIRDMSDDEATARIAADGIDVLVDVNGLTKDARTGIFARRAAPVQVNWLGFPGSMGSPYHNYIVADDWIIPPNAELYYSEKVVRLPCYQANDRRRLVSDQRPSRAECGFPADGVVFCCFNGAQKISRFTFDRWMEILKRTPGSILWLLDTTAEINARLGDHAEARGVARERLLFAPKLANPYHMARYPLADLFLDTSPYGAHTTASDALWMGVPVLTLSGRSFAARVCGSLVRSAGLPELVCETPEAFVELAVALAADPARLRALRTRLEAGRDTCVTFNMDLLTTSLENLYLQMCEAHAEGRTPAPDLTNLQAYLDVGVEIDHEAEELLAAPDYLERYKSGLARRHRMRPLPPDGRVWTPEAIAETERRRKTDIEPTSRVEAAAPLHPLLQLQNHFDAASLLLCSPLTASTQVAVQHHLDEASALEVVVPPGSDYEGWTKHYRLALSAIDFAALESPPTPPPKLGPVVFASANGTPMSLNQVKAHANKLKAKAVFFAAADDVYIDLYARLYILSILKHADIEALLIVHVIGGAAQLPAIAQAIGIKDERLVLAGDDFDPREVTAKAYCTPPTGLYAKPVAHLQSIRFLRLGTILHALNRPVFVSDIDLILQRGVKDLLDRFDGSDIVLNENESSTSAGSHFTANLLLAYPTRNAAIFTDSLSTYLQDHLGRAELTRWIDQFALMFAWQYLLRHGKSPVASRFDTNFDINNVMYRSYQPNPFRFLSLYNGFDLSTLDFIQQEAARAAA